MAGFKDHKSGTWKHLLFPQSLEQEENDQGWGTKPSTASVVAARIEKLMEVVRVGFYKFSGPKQWSTPRCCVLVNWPRSSPFSVYLHLWFSVFALRIALSLSVVFADLHMSEGFCCVFPGSFDLHQPWTFFLYSSTISFPLHYSLRGSLPDW